MPFNIHVNIKKFPRQINYNNKILLIGSCFAENIGDHLAEIKWPCVCNPFGIQYNPKSIKTTLDFALNHKTFNENDIFERNGLWYSFYHHSDYTRDNKQKMLDGINTSIKETSEFLKETSLCIITFGTAWIYKLAENAQVVSNCHKLPASDFTRHRLEIDEIVNDYNQLINDIKAINSKIQFVFTVSPVRHWKDGAIENSLSKATLLLAIDQIVSQNPQADYFPSYEIVLDELRDYRFFNEDMVHPNSVAVNYVWEKFRDTIFEEQTITASEEIKKITLARKHKIRFPKSTESQKFIKTMLQKVTQLKQQYPFVDFSDEENYFTNLIC